MLTDHLAIRWMNKRFGVNIPEDTLFDSNRFEDVLNAALPPKRRISKDEFWKIYVNEFLPSHEWNSEVVPMKGAQKIVRELSRIGENWVVTARCSVGLPVLRGLCDRFFSADIKGIHCVWKKLENGEIVLDQSKRDFIIEMMTPCSFFVDDNPKEVERVHKTIPTYLFDPRGVHKHRREFNRISCLSEIRVDWPPVGHA